MTNCENKVLWISPEWWPRENKVTRIINVLQYIGRSKKAQSIIRQGGHFGFLIGKKPTNFIEDVEILFLLKYCWIPFSGCRGEVGNVLANQRPRQPSLFYNWPQNTNFVEDVEILLPDKFRWIPFSGCRREVESAFAHQMPDIFVLNRLKNKKLVED